MAKAKTTEKKPVPRKKGESVILISAHALKTRKKNEKWHDAIKRSAKELKAAGKY